jgi:transposase
MAVNVRGGDLDQLLLMPPSMRDWLPEDHLAFFISEVVAELDLSEFYGAYREDGRGGAVYDPALVLRVLIYAYCTGERSSRRIEKRLVEDVAYRVLAANQQLDHATLARFRRRHQDAIASLFGQVLALCVKADLVNVGVIAIDGTKMAADASYSANRKREKLAAEILEEAEAVDAAEDEKFGKERGDKLPPEWAGGRDRRARIRAALADLDKRSARDYETRVAERAAKEAATGRKMTGPKPKAEPARRVDARRANTTDPHSRIIATGSRGVLQGYNAQAAATENQVVVAAEVHATTNDQPHFVSMTNAAAQNLAAAGVIEPVGTFLADAGYWTAANAESVVGSQVLIPTRKSSWRKPDELSEDKVAVLARVNRGELSQRQAGAILGVSYTWVRDMTKRYHGTEGLRVTRETEPEPDEWIPVVERLDRREISRRAAADQLGVSPQRVSVMLAHVRGEATDPAIARRTMDARLEDPLNAELFKKRSHSIEPVFGNIKGNLRYRRFTRRSLPAVTSEWRLICTAHNLLKLHQAGLA